MLKMNEITQTNSICKWCISLTIFCLGIGLLVLIAYSDMAKDHPPVITGKDEAKMILIPAGDFQMGTSDAEIDRLLQDNSDWKREWFDEEKPVHTVYLDVYYIDAYEVTNAQYAKFLNEYGKNEDAKGHQLIDIDSPSCLIENVENIYKSKGGNEDHPVTHVSWYGAAAYAQFYGKRLPTEAEWEKAARGGLLGKMYPWGDSNLDGKKANFADKNTFFNWSDKIIDDGYTRTAPVGSYPPNDYGLYDLAGNVNEWCADEYDEDYYSKSPRDNPEGPGTVITFNNDDFTNIDTLRVLRGGGWINKANFLRCATRYNLEPKLTTNGVGFRCVQDF
jgi:formylglycine-generating enzyme required for sulfatase activity